MKTFFKISIYIFLGLLLVVTVLLQSSNRLPNSGSQGIHMTSNGYKAYEVKGVEVLIGNDGLRVGIENKYGLTPATGLSESLVNFNNESCFDDQKVIGIAFATTKNSSYYATSSEAYKANLSTPNSKVTSSLVTINNQQFSKFERETGLGCSSGNCPNVYNDTYYVSFLGDDLLEVKPMYTSCGGRKLGEEKINEMINSIRIYR